MKESRRERKGGGGRERGEGGCVWRGGGLGEGEPQSEPTAYYLGHSFIPSSGYYSTHFSDLLPRPDAKLTHQYSYPQQHRSLDIAIIFDTISHQARYRP